MEQLPPSLPYSLPPLLPPPFYSLCVYKEKPKNNNKTIAFYLHKYQTFTINYSETDC